MSGQYEVLTEALHAHASALHDLADRLNEAADAARQVGMPDDAYGMICQFLPPVLNPLEEHGMVALQGSAEGMDTTAANVRDTAEDYAATDDRNAQAMHRMRGAL